MNSWGIIVLALAGGILWWAAKHTGSLAELGLGAAAAGGAAALASKSKSNSGGTAGESADAAGGASALTDAEALAEGLVP